MRTIKLKYGNELVELKHDTDEIIMEVNPPSYQISKDSFIKELSSCLTLNKSSNVGIVVSDKTRLCGYDIYLPWITDLLHSSGISKENITFFIAYGTHPKQSDEESIKAYGDTFKKYHFVHHDCSDKDSLITLGHTKAGTPIEIRKDIFEFDSLILFGAMSHHYFAGYGGGRKLIFPGLGGKEAIYKNHKLFIDFELEKLNPGCQSGQLDGNPIAMDLEEIDRKIPDKTIISGILNTSGEVSVLKIDKNYSEFKDTCQVYDKSYRSKNREKYDMVVASAGGYPKDLNFIQSHKSMHNAASFVKDGGNLILLAECRDGIGNKSFMSIFSGTTSEIVKDLSLNYSGNGGTALATLAKTSRINVYMMTDLNKEDCSKMGVNKVDLKEINSLLDSASSKIAIINNASIIF